MTDIKGIILQPLSNKKYSWKDYDAKKDDFLNFFQEIMKNEIGNRFDVDYSTINYSNHILIPYSTKTHECFGAYYILEGIKSGRSDLKWSFILDETRNQEFEKIIEQKNILGQTEMLGCPFEKVNEGNNDGSFHYLLNRPPKRIINFILNIGSISKTNIKKILPKKFEKKSKQDYRPTLSSRKFEKEKFLEIEKSKIENGVNAEKLVYESIKNDVNRKVLINELNKFFSNNKITEISSKIEDLIHYSKNFDPYAPFDLFNTRDDELIFIEVKSTTNNEIYFSKSEIEFAYENIKNYIVKIVKDNEIYELEIFDLIEEIYNNINNNQKWIYDTIKIRL